MKVYILSMTQWYYRSDVKGVYQTLEEAKAQGDEETVNESPVNWMGSNGYWLEDTKSDCQLEIETHEVAVSLEP